MVDCGSKISTTCAGLTVPMTIAGFQDLVGEIVSSGTFMIKMALATGGQSMSYNMLRGLNALRCAFVSGFFNSWMMLASVYFAAKEFGFSNDLKSLMDEAYPYICTCTEETNSWSTSMGASLYAAGQFSKCSSS